MSLSSPHVRRLARRALVDAIGGRTADPQALAVAFNGLCTRLRRRFQSLFGTTAVNALFARSLHVATSEFPWLSEVFATGDDCSPQALTNVQGAEMSVFEEGLAAVLAHNIGLLSTFVGEDLVLPLVEEAWGRAIVAEDQSGPKVINE
jgi:hypothetical protein